MADIRNTNVNRGIAVGRAQVAIDEGLRAYMLKVYNYMALAVALTGISALMVANMAITNDPSLAVATLGNGKMLTSLGATIYSPPLSYVFMFAPLAFVLVISFWYQQVIGGNNPAGFFGPMQQSWGFRSRRFCWFIRVKALPRRSL